MYVAIYICIYIYLCMYIYIYKERERERRLCEPTRATELHFATCKLVLYCCSKRHNKDWYTCIYVYIYF